LSDYLRLNSNASTMLKDPTFWSRLDQYATAGSWDADVFPTQQTQRTLSGTKAAPTILSDGPYNTPGTIQNLLDHEPAILTGPDAVNLILLPPYVHSGTHRGGSGYHSSFTDASGNQIVYGVVEYSTYGTAIPSPCTPATTVEGVCKGFPINGQNGDPGDASIETDLISHEVAEAATDNLDGAIIYSSNPTTGGSPEPEIGDLCNGLALWVNGVRWQQSWLQDQCRCDGNPFPHLPFLQGSPTWLNMPPGDAASYVGSGWVIGQAPIGQDHGIYQYQPGSKTFRQITANGAAAKIVSVDTAGNPWVINSAGNIYKWNPGTSTFSQFPALPGSQGAISVASIGTYANDAGTWAIRDDFTIWSWTGSSWQQTPGLGTKISIFSQSAANDGCGPVPFVIGTNGNIYRFVCQTNSFTSANGSGPDISTDFAVDWNGNVDWWNPNTQSFTHYIAAPWGTQTRIGGWSNGLWASSTANGQLAVITGK
jgi:hypothetical protein